MGKAYICNHFSRRRIEDSLNGEAPIQWDLVAICFAVDIQLQ